MQEFPFVFQGTFPDIAEFSILKVWKDAYKIYQEDSRSCNDLDPLLLAWLKSIVESVPKLKSHAIRARADINGSEPLQLLQVFKADTIFSIFWNGKSVLSR